MDCVNERWACKEEQLDTLSNKQKDNELVLVWTYENGPASQGYKSGNYRILAIVPEHSDDYRILVNGSQALRQLQDISNSNSNVFCIQVLVPLKPMFFGALFQPSTSYKLKMKVQRIDKWHKSSRTIARRKKNYITVMSDRYTCSYLELYMKR